MMPWLKMSDGIHSHGPSFLLHAASKEEAEMYRAGYLKGVEEACKHIAFHHPPTVTVECSKFTIKEVS